MHTTSCLNMEATCKYVHFSLDAEPKHDGDKTNIFSTLESAGFLMMFSFTVTTGERKEDKLIFPLL